MRRKSKLLVLAIAILTLSVTAVVFADLRRLATVRAERVSNTVSEIRQGNYFAWAQGRDWWKLLTEAEKTRIMAACRRYASAGRALHWQNETWPPESRAPFFFRCGLEYHPTCLPPFHEVPAEWGFAGILTNAMETHVR